MKRSSWLALFAAATPLLLCAATVLARAIFTEGLKMVSAGHDPMTLKRGIDKAVSALTAELRALS